MSEPQNKQMSLADITVGLVVSMRPKQWIKNLFVFASLAFSQNLTHWHLLSETVVTFFLFVAVSSAVYLLNDVLDLESDRVHPQKCRRPIASGTVPKIWALTSSGILAVGGIGICLALESVGYLGRGITLVLFIYLLINAAYSRWLKHVVILDVLLVSVGFVLRAVGGGIAIKVQISGWLVLCTILVSLFLALSKRRHELVMLEGDAANHRQILKEYTPYFLDQMIAVVTASTLMAYALYTMSPEATGRVGQRMIFTIPFVLYGIFRYLYLVHQHQKGGDPTEIMLSDRPMIINVLLWVVAVTLILTEVL
ncbi:MAG TPA: decaprenyl-phosphate phosphoribosyltransferase [bacterium]|nr:decaprenyl-phosphate phosphoribosyltransferase [bacterium]